MESPVVLLLRHTHDAARSRELLEMAAALAVFALPVAIACLAPADTLLATEDPGVMSLLEELPAYGSVTLLALSGEKQAGFQGVDAAAIHSLIHSASAVIGD